MLRILCGAMALSCPSVHATFSIVACEPESGTCGVAVATHNLAVGDGVPFAVADVGAGVSQFETNPRHADVARRALADGASAADAIKQSLARDASFGDGLDLSFRQLAVVSSKGSVAVHTGKEAGDFAGQRGAHAVSVQGNGLVSAAVLDAMLVAYERSDGPLAERLLQSLEAGHAAGGQRIGVMSAALLVRTSEGWPVDVDLRVDFSSVDAVSRLRAAYNASRARVLLGRANRSAKRGNMSAARTQRDQALQLAPTWDRIWLRAARLSRAWGDREHATLQACVFYRLNPMWARALSEEIEIEHCDKTPGPNDGVK
ncbi:MAG: DUF1028 domain-containing protein [Gammaproteobacteria bacterium]